MKACQRKVQFFAFRRDPERPKWIWLGRCAEWLGNGGWVHLSARWFWRQAIEAPAMRRANLRAQRQA